jgi:hypothetical protein
MWSFLKTQKAPWDNAGVELTEDEAEECQRFIKAITTTDDGYFAVHIDFADTLRRVFVAMCLMGRAERFLVFSGFIPTESGMIDGNPSRSGYRENVASALEASSKACVIHPMSINLYDFACILRSVGYKEEAKASFSEFLRLHNNVPVQSFEKVLISGRDMEGAVNDATNETSGTLDEIRDEDIPF